MLFVLPMNFLMHRDFRILSWNFKASSIQYFPCHWNTCLRFTWKIQCNSCEVIWKIHEINPVHAMAHSPKGLDILHRPIIAPLVLICDCLLGPNESYMKCFPFVTWHITKGNFRQFMPQLNPSMIPLVMICGLGLWTALKRMKCRPGSASKILHEIAHYQQ